MEDRHQRRPLPSRSDIGMTHVRHDRDAKTTAECGPVADLHAHALVGPMDYGLAVEADDVDIRSAEAVIREEGLHRLRMGRSDEGFRLREATGPVFARDHGFGIGQRPAKQLAILVGIAAIAGGTERLEITVMAADHLHILAVGLDQRHVGRRRGRCRSSGRSPASWSCRYAPCLPR